MSDRPSPVTLRLAPHAIPELRAAFDEALASMSRQLSRLRDEGYLREPWLGDEISAEVADFYNRRVMDSTDGPYAALVAYEAELLKVRDTLQRMEDEYRRTEGDNARLGGRL
jgi:hypothetical protein